MYKTAFVVTTSVLVLSLAGLAYFAFAQPDACTGSNHCISVWVQTDAGVPTIHVSALDLHKHGKKHVIFWDIDNTDTPRYTFPDNGITFIESDRGTQEFRCDRVSATKFRCKDPEGNLGKYKYTVRVEGTPRPGPLPPDPLDPWIHNE